MPSKTPQKPKIKKGSRKEVPAEQPVSKAKPIKCKACDQVCLEKEFHENIDDDSIDCDVCGHWYHKPCTNNSTEEWELLRGNNENITFKCDNCVKSKAEYENRQTELSSNLEKIFSRLESLEAKILISVDQKINDRIQQFEDKNNKAIDEIRTQVTDISQNKQDILAVEEKIKVQLSESLDELREREERKNNLIFFNVKESTKEDDDEAIQEDIQIIKSIIQYTNPELPKVIDKITEEKTIRLGKRPAPNDQSSKPRPIKLTLPQESDKYKIMKNSFKLKTFKEHPKIGVRLDLSKQQQLEEKALKEEVERRRNLKEDVMIFRGQVILRSDHSRLKKELDQRASESTKSQASSKDNQ